ncbi:MAG: DUF4249 domain-containing protein [Flavobacteriales bacterium]|nr:DUF4249 domain-containing protein [Flavobacteriales bacterium]
MKTSNSILTLLAFAMIVGAGACRKVVDWELEGAEERLVIEGAISNLTQPWEVRLTLTRDYFDNKSIPTVETALVTISDDLGNLDTLYHTGDGNYRTTLNKSCVPGRFYTLEVNYAGRKYTCTELCREQEPIDTFTYFYQPFKNGFIEVGYYVFEIAQEIDNPGDYYEWVLYKNDTLQDDFGYILDTDEFADFSYFNQNIDLDNINLEFLPRPFPFNFDVGDRIRLEQRCVSKNYFDYLNEFSTQYNRQGSPFDAPPSNPTGNILGAYGFFSVQNIEIRELLIEEL